MPQFIQQKNLSWHLGILTIKMFHVILSLSLLITPDVVYFFPLYIFDFHLDSHILCRRKLSAHDAVPQSGEDPALLPTGDVYTHLQQIHLDKSCFIFSLNSVVVSHRNYFFDALASCPRLLLFCWCEALNWRLHLLSCVFVERWVRTDLLQPPHAVLLCCSEASLCPLPPPVGRKMPTTFSESRDLLLVMLLDEQTTDKPSDILKMREWTGLDEIYMFFTFCLINFLIFNHET